MAEDAYLSNCNRGRRAGGATHSLPQGAKVRGCRAEDTPGAYSPYGAPSVFVHRLSHVQQRFIPARAESSLRARWETGCRASAAARRSAWSWSSTAKRLSCAGGCGAHFLRGASRSLEIQLRKHLTGGLLIGAL